MKYRQIVFTGGPGSGKTSIINALSSDGFKTLPESGRTILESDDGLALRTNYPLGYAMEMLDLDIRNHASSLQSSESIFFDRGFPDIVSYLRLIGQSVPKILDSACKNIRYSGPIFSAPPWTEIYKNDAERTQSFQTAIATYDAVLKAWFDYGYITVNLPLATIKERIKFVLDRTD